MSDPKIKTIVTMAHNRFPGPDEGQLRQGYVAGYTDAQSRDRVVSEDITSLYVDYTNTGTVGAVTINKAAMRVNIAATGTSIVVTNSLVTAASHVFCLSSTADTTARVTDVVPAAGSFTMRTVATTAQISFRPFCPFWSNSACWNQR